jgi:solute carrier family 10 (sodium/bile acid cotransporter), member 7
VGWLKRNWFLIGLLLAMALGLGLGGWQRRLNPDGWTNRAVVLVLFLITGLKLPSERIGRQLANVRVHLLVQTFIFAVVPLWFLTAIPVFGDALDGQLLVGILALSVLPTTVSSCIVLTDRAGGNTVAAVFNAALANMGGILLSPLLLSLLLSSSGRALPADQLLSTLRGLALNMLLPIAVGQGLRFLAADWVRRRAGALGVGANGLILLIVVLAFARTAENPAFVNHARQLIWPGLYLMASHLVLTGLAWLSGALLRLGDAERIAVLFVAPQKTLAMGAPLLTIFFQGQDILGIALLPLLIYHPWQLLVAGLLINPLGRRGSAENAARQRAFP